MADSGETPVGDKENPSQAVSPASLAGVFADLVVANFDHRCRQVLRAGMPLDRVVDIVGRGVGLVDANRERRVGLQLPDETIGQAPVVAKDDTDLPGPLPSEKIGMKEWMATKAVSSPASERRLKHASIAP